MTRYSPPIVTTCVALFGCFACGGEAGSHNEDPAPLPQTFTIPEPAPESAALPESFVMFELRRIGEQAAPLREPAMCDPYEYSLAMTVNLQTRQFTTRACMEEGGSYVLRTAEIELLDPDIDRIIGGYRQLSRELSHQCLGGDLITLDLLPEGGPALPFADGDHSSCPVARLGRDRFLSGLPDLHVALAAVVDRRSR